VRNLHDHCFEVLLEVVLAFGEDLIPSLFVCVVDLGRQFRWLDPQGLEDREELIVQVLEVAVSLEDVPLEFVARIVIVDAQSRTCLLRTFLVADSDLELNVVSDITVLPQQNLHVEGLLSKWVHLVSLHVLVSSF
jgi:hypothetical protein